ncbi:DegV family protein [Leuconostocaceae bacterium ESL0958]|nr:DegV family protein [Leuconostocaceae bacterium ESL0958]
MTKVQIVTDSAATLTKGEIAQYDIRVIPMTVEIEGTVYQDGVTITNQEFLDKMATAKELPKTSQPTIGAFQEVYDRCYQDDPEAAVFSMHVDSKLSGTVNTAHQADSLTKAAVHPFDTLMIDRAEGFIVLAAAKVAQAGGSLAEVQAAAEEARSECLIYLSFRELDNVVAGGRLSKTQGLIGNLLNIKVGAWVNHEGELAVIKKGRGLKTIAAFNDDIIAKMQAYQEIKQIGVSYTGVKDEAIALKERLEALFPGIDILLSVANPVVSTHTGMGALAVLFQGKE